jgi:hypothetical protein
VVLIVPPVGCDHVLRDIRVDIWLQERTALQYQQQPGGERVGDIVLRCSERLGEFTDGIVSQVAAILRKVGHFQVSSGLDQIRLDADFIQAAQPASVLAHDEEV